MAHGDKTRLSDWSRRKLKAREEARAVALETEAPPLPAVPADEEAAQAPDLPEIDSLTGESDFSVFMRQGVPDHLRNLALRKLWSTDPVYANLDGLNDYDPSNMKFLEQIAETAKDLLERRLREERRERREREQMAAVSKDDAVAPDATAGDGAQAGAEEMPAAADPEDKG